mgnify:FL=1
MDSNEIRSPILLIVCALWMGCLSISIALKITIGVLIIVAIGVVQKRRHLVIPFATMLLLGIGMKHYNQWTQAIPKAPLTGMWTCKSEGIRKEGHHHTLLCRCDRKHAPFRMEWSYSSPPPLDTAFLGSLMPFSNVPRGVIEWKHRRGIVGALHPPWTQKDQKGKWPPQQENIKTELWRDLDRSFTPHVSGLLFALTTGDKAKIPYDTRTALTHAGLAHLLAVSGYHVGLVAIVPLFLLRRRRWLLRALGFISLMGVWWYISLCGWPVSAIRAGIMASLFAALQLVYRPVSSIQILALSAWAMLIIRPSMAGELGAQLSFVAVLSILLMIQSLNRKNRSMKVASVLAVPVSAQWGTGFLSWSVFGVFPVHFLIFNLIASPLMAFIGLGLAGWLLVRWLAPIGWGDTWAYHLNSILEPIIHCFTIAHHTAWSLYVGAVPTWIWWVISAGFLFSAVAVNLSRITWLKALLFNSCTLITLAPWIGWHLISTTEISCRKSVILTMQPHDPVSILFDARDTAFYKRQCTQRNVSSLHRDVIEPGTFWFDSQGNWLVRSTDDFTLGKIKNRPIRISRLGGSSRSIVFGADRCQVTSWGDPVHFRRNVFNSDEVNW